MSPAIRKSRRQFQIVAAMSGAAAFVWASIAMPDRVQAQYEQPATAQEQLPASAGQSANTRVALPPPVPPQDTNTTAAQSGQATAPAAMAPGEQAGTAPATPPVPRATARDDASARTDTMGRAELGVMLVPRDGPGVLISSVFAGSAAEAAGLQAGDYILGIDGQLVSSPQAVVEYVRQMQPGQQSEIRYWRNGAEHAASATLQESRRVDTASYFSPVEGAVIYDDLQPVGYGGVYPVRRRYYGYYPGPFVPYGTYYRGWPGYYGYGYPYSYGYYGTPRFGYYRSPWSQGVQIGPFGFRWW
jgi:membrane-associated protease RseP (regulator of RpoE activity)